MKGGWSGGYKGDKGKGKGKGYQGQCWRCGQIGHKQDERPNQHQRVQSVQQVQPGQFTQQTMGPIASPEPIHPRSVVSPTSAGFTQVGSVPVNSVWMLGGSVPVNNIEVGYKPIATQNMFGAITEAHDDDDEEWPALKSLEPPQAMKMAKKEAFWMKAQAKEKERKLRSKEDDELMQALIDTQRSNKKVRFCGPNFGPCNDDCCEKPVTGELVKSKLLMSEELVKSKLLMSEKPVKGSGLLMSEKPVKGSWLLMSEKPVTGKLVSL